MQGSGFILQQGPQIAIVTACLPASQTERLAATVQAVFDSFVVE